MNAPSDEAGFSTIEVLVAFSILSFGLALLLQTVSQSAITSRTARSISSDLEIAKQSAAERRFSLQTENQTRGSREAGQVKRYALRSQLGRGMTLIVVGDPGRNTDQIAIVPARRVRR